jgi:hypothetical protein
VTDEVPLLDDHAHPFPFDADALDLSALSLSVEASARERRAESAPSRLMLERLRFELARLLDCPPEEVEAARNEAARDWPGWVRRLFADAGIGAMLLDGGMAPVPPTELGVFAKIANVPMGSLLRLEAVIDPLLEQGADGPSIVAAVAEFVSSGAAAGASGLKTVLAYRTGLAVEPAVSADGAYRSIDTSVPVRRRAKPLRDYILRRTLAQCAELGLPIQIHTGFGDSEIRLAEANPILLDELLRTPEGAAADVVLIHAGYPWHEELAYLAWVRENLWAELSLVNLFSPVTTADRLLRLLDLAPADRILLGTDGHGSPETHWFAAKTLRSAWTEIGHRLAGLTRESWLADTARRLFYENAAQLYPGEWLG